MQQCLFRWQLPTSKKSKMGGRKGRERLTRVGASASVEFLPCDDAIPWLELLRWLIGLVPSITHRHMPCLGVI